LGKERKIKWKMGEARRAVEGARGLQQIKSIIPYKFSSN
jgi:hypothetical protein